MAYVPKRVFVYMAVSNYRSLSDFRIVFDSRSEDVFPIDVVVKLHNAYGGVGFIACGRANSKQLRSLITTLLEFGYVLCLDEPMQRELCRIYTRPI